MAFLQDSCKILARNCALSQEGKSCKIPPRFLQEFVIQDFLQEINPLYTHYVLIIHAFHQKPSIINRYRKILMNFTTVEHIL